MREVWNFAVVVTADSASGSGRQTSVKLWRRRVRTHALAEQHHHWRHQRTFYSNQHVSTQTTESKVYQRSVVYFRLFVSRNDSLVVISVFAVWWWRQRTTILDTCIFRLRSWTIKHVHVNIHVCVLYNCVLSSDYFLIACISSCLQVTCLCERFVVDSKYGLGLMKKLGWSW